MTNTLPMRRVRLPVNARVAAVGIYRPGQIIEVPSDEAERLIRVKGFEPVDLDASGIIKQEIEE